MFRATGGAPAMPCADWSAAPARGPVPSTSHTNLRRAGAPTVIYFCAQVILDLLFAQIKFPKKPQANNLIKITQKIYFIQERTEPDHSV